MSDSSTDRMMIEPGNGLMLDVVDFLLLHYDDWYFPAFNVADSSVSVGAALMILDVVLSSRRDSSQVAEDA